MSTTPTLPGLSGPLRQRATRDVAIQMVTKVVNLALGVVVTALLVRTLGDERFGQWSTLLVITTTISFFKDLGLTTVAVREAAADPEHESEWISALLVIQALLSIPVFVASLITIMLVSNDHAMLVAGLVLIAGLPFGVFGTFGTVFAARMRNGRPMALMTFNSVTWGAAVVAIYALDGGMIELAIASTATAIATNMITMVLSLRVFSLKRPSRAAMRRLISVGTPMAIASTLILAYASIDQFLVFTIAGSSDAGLYGSVLRIVQAWIFIPASLMVTLSPLLAASWPGDRDRVFRACRVAIEYLGVASLGMCAFILAAADPIVRLLFTDEFAAAAPALMVFGGVFVLTSYGFLTDNLMLVLNRQRQLMWIALLGLVVNLAANFVLIPTYGFMGAAWTTLGTELLVEGIAVVILLRAFEVRRLHAERLLRIILAAVILALGLEACEALGVSLLGLCVVAGLSYPALLIGLRAVEVREVTNVLLRRQSAI